MAIDISNLENCIEDARQAALDQDPGPADPLQYNPLRGRLHAARPKIPRLYQDTAFDPYSNTLDGLGESDFNQILLNDPDHTGAAGLLLDCAQAFLQRGEGFETKALGAFQEVVADLYDGFLSAEDRGGVEPPDNETIPPLVKFGNPDSGPYTWPVDATANFGMKVGVVNLPPSNARRGLLAWPALSHETCGHDVLHADNGLLNEVSTAVRAGLANSNDTATLAAYWADRIDETASDVLGILNMGPAPGIGLIGYFRALNAAFGQGPVLRNSGPSADPHPADIVRGFLAGATVRQLKFDAAADWADLIDAETQKDVTHIVLAGNKVDVKTAKKSATIVSQVIVTHPMSSLEKHAFGEIQNWRNEDEDIVQDLRSTLNTLTPSSTDLSKGVYAAHLVAAATMSALAEGGNIALLFSRMLDLLKVMHDKNPSFGPLRVRHAGNLARDRAYIPTRISANVATLPIQRERRPERKRA
ncbi:MAG TPA: hypothetical protein VLK33_07250 [Terriglobales bacterium]|nr:hypothetical protein [Terriglobales bacterium]